MGRHKDRVHRRFGDSDVDRLAQAIYTEFHRDTNDYYQIAPWPLYSKQKGDWVVEWFRCAAEAAIVEHAASEASYRDDCECEKWHEAQVGPYWDRRECEKCS